MSLDIIEKLKKAPPKKRAKIVLDMQQKNIQFFKRRYPDVGNAIEQMGTGRYEVRIDPNFLDIIDQTTGQVCHPAGQLLKYTEKLGAPHHTGWIDKLSIIPNIAWGIEHGDRLAQFIQKIQTALPVVVEHAATGIVSLPYMSDGKRFSGVTVFLGIFTGLHILNYLNNSNLIDAVFIEPDVEKFSLSCLFIDYAALEQKIGRLVLHIGPNMPQNLPELLIGQAPMTATAWLRFLPAYPSKDFDNLIANFELRWRALTEIFVPFDREVRNMCYGARNLKKKTPINFMPPQLSENSRIIVIGAGPSLGDNVEWLKENQDKLIIIAAHSAMRTLNKNGIRPDFQCNLDTELDEGFWELLEMQPDIPFICYFKSDEKSVISYFKDPLLFNESGKANPVAFSRPITFTHPTTGNSATAVAVFAQPKQLFFLGLDLGFRDQEQDHVKGYWEGQGRSRESGTPVAAAANFPESEGQIFTYAYYNSARFTVEAALRHHPEIEVFNLSDGVKIEGAKPQHTEQLELAPYPEKASDLEKFQAAFTSEHEGVWRPYPRKGAEMLKAFRDAVKERMTLKEFNWLHFTRALDSAWNYGVAKSLEGDVEDLRIEAYSKLIHDLLSTWYRMIVFTKTPAQTQQGYELGLKILMETLEDLQWPEELDEWADETVEEGANTEQSLELVENIAEELEVKLSL